MKRLTLYCFPYAGGSSGIFSKWRQYIDKHIELRPVELAGRGKRIYDPLYQSIDEAIDDIYQLIKNDLHKSPFAFFGHSMGGIIAYEMAIKLKANNMPEPSHIFFSGRGAPHVPSEDEEMYYILPDDQFREKILELGGTPKEFFEHPELMEVLLPMLRSDFKIAETYKYTDEIVTLNHDITVFIGKDEDVSAQQMHGWKDLTTQKCTIHYVEGGHFFINEKTEYIIKTINNTLLPAPKDHKS
ncbi:MAG: thioesterase II family protein [Candidatus Omnitrophota bacterium]